ncbi:hydantoinase/oxoprolinase family protein [Chthonobacter rhizosphaerae]|uniref:hydantoinase/oxoprolinase family protein n=1 Tax=Chthonobacter rhizosphaerae TaxID=2735553 RepID=UPI0015EFBD85|nr:hydantoinase/oxoprolinase family protein [Chthonobacter rhizosphaerae]
MTLAGTTAQAAIGWDIGGAHLKAARVEGGRVVAVAQEPCALWQGLDRLEAAFDAIGARLGAAPLNPATMTGELVDLFDSRAAGVDALAAVAARRLAGVSIYAADRGFVSPLEAARHVDAIASANWHATAALVGARLADALLVDMGSTTTDVIPVLAGRVAARGRTDAGRMEAGELVYTGATRTPLMAVAIRVPVAGRWTTLMAEHFATMADANRLLGRLADGDDQHGTADGRGKSVPESRLRLSRMTGRDVADLPEAAWTALARAFAEAQVRSVHDAALLCLSALSLPDAAPVVSCGIGRAAVADVAARLGRPLAPVEDLVPLADPADPSLRAWAGACAPAVAVALLASADPSTSTGS